ncbi:MAG TPA: hypothetical protein VH255_09860 [Verrucomicrobiae bacterium]|nr:hypothetical protein [Verrucomicrobiae bacterium]
MKYILLFSFFLLALCEASEAQSNLVQSATFSSSNFSVNFATTNGITSYEYYPVFSMPVEQFNPAMGTLQSVNLAFEFVFSGTLDIGPSGGSATMSAIGNFYVNTNPSAVYGAGNGDGNGGGPGSIVPLGFTNMASTVGGTGLTDPAISTGTGQFTLSYEPVVDIYNVSGVNNIAAGLVSGSMSVTYVYLPSIVLTNISASGTNFSFRFTSVANYTNSVQTSTNLTSGQWTSITNFVGDGSVKIINVPRAGSPTRFFRLQATD